MDAKAIKAADELAYLLVEMKRFCQRLGNAETGAGPFFSLAETDWQGNRIQLRTNEVRAQAADLHKRFDACLTARNEALAAKAA